MVKTLLRLFQNTYFKNKTKWSPRFLQITSKTRKLILEILLNYLKTKHMESPRFFQITSKTRRKGSLRFFQATSKTKHKESHYRDSYFKNQVQRVSEILSKYVLQKQNSSGPRDFFKLLQKQNTSSPRDSSKLLQKPDTTVPWHFFKLCTSKIKHMESPRFFLLQTGTKEFRESI